jgi:hypothetical protein
MKMDVAQFQGALQVTDRLPACVDLFQEVQSVSRRFSFNPVEGRLSDPGLTLAYSAGAAWSKEKGTQLVRYCHARRRSASGSTGEARCQFFSQRSTTERTHVAFRDREQQHVAGYRQCGGYRC